jgi:hypothetical protein
MKKSLTMFLQIATVLIGIGTLALMLWEPHLEGRNTHSTLFQIYFNDPFLAYAYTASIPFFVALFQIFKLLRYMGRDILSSQIAMNALRNIKYCAITLIIFIVGAEAYFLIAQRGKDDIAGGVAIGLAMIILSILVVIVTTMFQKHLYTAVGLSLKTDTD